MLGWRRVRLRMGWGILRTGETCIPQLAPTNKSVSIHMFYSDVISWCAAQHLSASNATLNSHSLNQGGTQNKVRRPLKPPNAHKVPASFCVLDALCYPTSRNITLLNRRCRSNRGFDQSGKT